MDRRTGAPEGPPKTRSQGRLSLSANSTPAKLRGKVEGMETAFKHLYISRGATDSFDSLYG
jgi:hypothetical protein